MALGVLDFSALRETLRMRTFAIFTAGNCISVIGSWMQRLATGWLMWRLTQSGSWLGALSMSELAPAILLAPIIGVINDRFDRRRIAMIGQYLAIVQSVVLAILTLTGTITPMLMIVLQLTAGVFQPLIQTARLVLVPSMVPRERVGNAIAITSLTFNVARIVGPMLAAALIGAVGPGWVFIVNAVTYPAAIYALVILEPAPQTHLARKSLMHSLRTETTAGWRYIAQHPLLGWIVPTVWVATLLTWPISDLLPGIVDKVFARGPTALATLVSAYGAGAILGGLLLAQRPSPAGLARIVVMAMAMNGVMLALFASTSQYWLALPLLLGTSFFNVMLSIGAQSLAQIGVSDNMRGRALSTWYMVTRIGPAIGGVSLGSLSNHFGFQKPLMCAGTISAATAAIMWYRKRDAIRAIPRPDTI